MAGFQSSWFCDLRRTFFFFFRLLQVFQRKRKKEFTSILGAMSMFKSSKSRKRGLQLREAESEGVCGGESLVNGGGSGSEEEEEEVEGSPRDSPRVGSGKEPKSKAYKVKVRRKTSSAVYAGEEEEEGRSSLQDSIDGTAGEESAEDKGKQQKGCEEVGGQEKMDSSEEEGQEKMEECGSPQEKVVSLGEKGEEECGTMVESVEGSAREKKAVSQEPSLDKDVGPADVNSDSTEPQPSSVKESDQGKVVNLMDESPVGRKRKRRKKRERSRSNTPSTNAEEDSTDSEEGNSRSGTSRSVTSRSVTPSLCNAVLTDTMMEEEERLREREGSEESEQRGEVTGERERERERERETTVSFRFRS